MENGGQGVSINLDEYESLCDKNQKRIKSKDKRSPCIHMAVNELRHNVRQYQIDGIVIKEGNKCDFLVINDELHHAYLIELKSSKVPKATVQTDETYNKIHESLPNYTFYFRIVYKGANTHNIRSKDVVKWLERHGKTKDGIPGAVVKEEYYEEKISG